MKKKAIDLKPGDQMIIANLPVTVKEVWDLGGQVLIFCDNGRCYSVLSGQLCLLAPPCVRSRVDVGRKEKSIDNPDNRTAKR